MFAVPQHSFVEQRFLRKVSAADGHSEEYSPMPLSQMHTHSSTSFVCPHHMRHGSHGRKESLILHACKSGKTALSLIMQPNQCSMFALQAVKFPVFGSVQGSGKAADACSSADTCHA